MTERPAWTLNDLPIPQDVRPGPGWTEQMLEMADHIGPYATLLLVDRFAGQNIYVPKDPAKGQLAGVIGTEKAAIMSRIYQCNRLTIPRARSALDRARRAPIVAMARNGDMTISEAAIRACTTRTFMSFLVNRTDEGCCGAEIQLPRRAADPRQIEMFDIEG